MKPMISNLKQLPRQGQAGEAPGGLRDPLGSTPAPNRPTSTNTFSVFALDDVVTNSKQTVTAGLWSDGLGSLTTFFTSSTQTTS